MLLRFGSPLHGRARSLAQRGQSVAYRGQSLVEFALVLPLLAVLLFGTIQLGITLGGYNGLINAVREAARYASVCAGPTSGTTCSSMTAQRLRDGMRNGVFAYKAGSDTAIVTYSTYQDAGQQYNAQVRVTGCLRGIVFLPIVGNLLGWTDPTGVYLKSTETFRVEGQPAASPPATPPAATSPSGATCP